MIPPLFDSDVRRSDSASLYAEPEFRFLNRSSRPVFAAAREDFEQWFGRYPEGNDKGDVRRRFRQDRASIHRGAAFELFIHELLLRLGFRVQVHPAIDGFQRKPDFLAEWGTSSCLVEATYESGTSREEETIELLTSQAYDIIDASIRPSRHYLTVKISGAPTRLPSKRQIVQPIANWLEHAELSVLSESSELDVPLDKGNLRIGLLRTNARDTSSRGYRPIGAMIGEAKRVDDVTPVAEALRAKGKGYPNTLPYLVALGTKWTVDQSDFQEALFGTVSYMIGKTTTGDFASAPQQNWDGLWGSPWSPKRTRISAVLQVPGFLTWTAFPDDAVVVHNPWAKRPLSRSPFDRLSRLVPVDNRMNQVSGESLRSVFSLK